MRKCAGKVGAQATSQVIHANHALPAVEQRIDQVAPDKAGGASDDDNVNSLLSFRHYRGSMNAAALRDRGLVDRR
jgi:hypothetical protein